MFVESSSFAASEIAGTIAVSAGSARLGFLVAAAASITANTKFQNNAGFWYDSIVSFLGAT